MFIGDRNMVKLSFVKIMPEDFDDLGGILDNGADGDKLREELLGFKRVIFAMKSGDEILGAASLVFEVNDPDLTEPMNKILLSDMAVGESVQGQGYEGIMLEYIAGIAKDMGYSSLTVRVGADDPAAMGFYKFHGFTVIVSEEEGSKYIKLQRDLNEQVKCCGCGNV